MRRPFSWKWVVFLAALPLPSLGQTVVRQVEEAARAHWMAHAKAQGWRNADVEVVLATRAPPGLRCVVDPEVVVTEGRHASRTQLRASCPGPQGWQHDFVARVQLKAEVLVSRQGVPAGRVLDDDAIGLERRDVTATPDALAAREAVVGQSPKRALKPGQVLQQRFLHQAVLVRRGAAVRIVAHHSGISVEAAGEAQEAGALGEVIRVRNIATGKALRARVVDAGVVEPAE